MTSKGATMDVGAWLQGLGLGEYEATFRENAIDDTVLPNVTAEDLKDLGVGIVGHRRKLLDAIAALHATENEKAAPATSASTPPSTAVPIAPAPAHHRRSRSGRRPRRPPVRYFFPIWRLFTSTRGCTASLRPKPTCNNIFASARLRFTRWC